MRIEPDSFMRFLEVLMRAAKWWLLELRGMAPWIEKALADPQAHALLQDDGDSTNVALMDIGATEWRREMLDASLDQLSEEQIQALSAWCGKRSLSVSLNPSKVYRLRLQVPKGTNASVRQSIKYRLLTDSPLAPESVVFAERRLAPEDGGEKPNKKMITVEVALCHRDSIDRLKSLIQKLNLPTPHIGVAQQGSMELDFLFERARGLKTASARFYRNMLLAFGPLFICIIALLASWSYAEWKTRVLSREISGLSSRTEESLRLLTRQARARAISKSILNDVPDQGVLQILNDIAHTLPPSAWLTEVRFDGNKLKLIGNGQDPTAIVKSISATKALTAVRLETVISAAVGPSHFEITAEISSGRRK